MPDIKLPDGAVRQFPQPVTVAEIAASIGPGLAKAALAGRVDGELVDNSFASKRMQNSPSLPSATRTVSTSFAIPPRICSHTP